MSTFPIHTITLQDKQYPPLLKTIAKPPHTLFLRGNLDALLHPQPIAVVGTRKATKYGTDATKIIVTALANAAFSIVSGLAFGIDATAHRTAIDTHGITIAVLGTGVADHDITPRQHLNLAHDIMANGGALLSEYPPSITYGKWTYAARNRIIAGMSHATVVIEAAEKSGALITAHHAIDMNRELFALPGPITAETSHGTNRLIAQGAMPILGPETIPQYYGHTILLPQASLPTFADHTTAAIYDLCCNKQQSPETAAHHLNLPIKTVLSHLTMIELQTAKN